MRRTISQNNKSKEILSDIKKDLSSLIRQSNSNHKDAKQLKKTIDKIHNELNQLETNEEKKMPTHNYVEDHKDYHRRPTSGVHEYIMDVVIKKKIITKKTKVSKSFGKWLFNNNEL